MEENGSKRMRGRTRGRGRGRARGRARGRSKKQVKVNHVLTNVLKYAIKSGIQIDRFYIQNRLKSDQEILRFHPAKKNDYTTSQNCT